MSLTEQYALDLYRAARRGEPAPPAPRPGDWRTIRELSRYRDVRAVGEERPARGAARRAVRARLAALFARRRAAGEAAVTSADRPATPRNPLQEGDDRGRDVVRRPLQCG
ncbi:hypothetical protein [Streptomyces sp. ME19-01-6]|uniref:hypothetical protein n=1 Tax=Streptomyces sp. ME19-01-6 TaxID=3028686 RepID=UPI0029BC535C|nr:hypothetical protein [Streptomyces sp. ME19-01-6]MDX3228248.1 hypothetical protein [Streptomyces sp. ME19-01-6]